MCGCHYESNQSILASRKNAEACKNSRQNQILGSKFKRFDYDVDKPFLRVMNALKLRKMQK